MLEVCIAWIIFISLHVSLGNSSNKYSHCFSENVVVVALITLIGTFLLVLLVNNKYDCIDEVVRRRIIA